VAVELKQHAVLVKQCLSGELTHAMAIG
jgi:hypothetical protein